MMTDCLCQYGDEVHLGGCIKMVKNSQGNWYMLYSHTFAWERGDNIDYCPFVVESWQTNIKQTILRVTISCKEILEE